MKKKMYNASPSPVFSSLLTMLFGCWLSVTGFAQPTPPLSSTQESQEKVRHPSSKPDEDESAEAALRHANSRWYKQMHTPNADYFSVLKNFTDYFKKHPQEHSAPRENGETWLKTMLFYLNASGRVSAPPATNYNAIPQGALASAPVVTDTISGDWRMVGPRNSVQVGAGLGNHGGYVSCVRFDPANPSKLFVSFQMGGLWTSANNGGSWRLSDANMPAESYYDIDVCKANTTIVYAVSAGAVIKSIDGGFSWSTTALNRTNYAGSGYDIAVSPTDPNVVIAKWGTALYRTINGGTSWTSVKTGLKDFSIWGNCEILDWDNNHNTTVFLTDRDNNQNYVDVYKSTDGGVTFAFFVKLTLPAGSTGTVVGWSKIYTPTTAPNGLYILLGSGNDAYKHVAVQMYKLDYATAAIERTRTNMVNGLNTGYGSTTTLHHGDIAMDITNENRIVYAGYSQQSAQYSTDNGVTFKSTEKNIHSDIRSVFVSNGKVILGTDGSAYISTDGSVTYTHVTNTISNHELWGFGSAFKSDLLVAGCNHGPLMIRDYESPGGWYSVLGADQGNSDINPLDSVTIYSQGYDSYHVIRTGIKSFRNTSQLIDPGGIYDYFNQMEFHPNLYRTLITHHGGGYPSGNPNLATWKKSLIRSDDNGLTLRVLYTFSDRLFREKICMTNPNVIYVVVGLTNNKLLKSTDGGTSWTDITPSTAVTTTGIRNISDIAVSDANPNEVWVTYSGVQNTCQVLYSSTGGSSYSNLTTSVLTSNPVTKIIFQRGTNGGVYIGNMSGIYYRNHTMTNWMKLGFGLPQADIRFMFINYNKGKLLIGTSRGGWDHNLYEPSATRAQISASTTKPSVCEVVRFKDYSVVKNASARWQWTFPGGTPSSSTAENPVVSYKNAAQGYYNVSLTVTDANGTNTQTLTNFIYVSGTSTCANGGIVSGDTYKLISAVNNTSVLDVPASNTADGTALNLWSDNGGGPNQKWVITDAGNGYYTVTSSLNGSKALDVNGGFSTDGTQVQLWTANGSTAQRWKITPVGNTYFQLSPECAPGSSLDVNAASPANGTKIQIWTSNSSNAQKWKLFNVSTGSFAGRVAQETVLSMQEEVSDAVTLYPNPVVNQTLTLSLSAKESSLGTIELMNTQGQVILMKKAAQAIETVDVSELPNGMYVVKVQQGEKSITRKIVVQH